MPIKSYLTPQRTLLLKGNNHAAAVQELVEAVCNDEPRLDLSAVLAAVADREAEISTRITPTIALPHARIPGIGDFILAVGISAGGVKWDIERDQDPVHVVALLLGDADHPKEHIRALAELAGLFSRPGALKTLMESEDAGALFRNLIGLQEDVAEDKDLPGGRRAESLQLHAAQLAEELSAQAVVVIGAKGARPPKPEVGGTSGPQWILASPPKLKSEPAEGGAFDQVLEIPSRGLLGRQRVDVVILMCLLKRMIRPADTVVCVYGRHSPSRVDTIRVVDVAVQFGELWQLSDEIDRGDIEPSVLYRVLQLANDISMEGREGHPLGTLFVLGDHGEVAKCCNQLVLNPFRGYSEEELDILDPSLDETLKEFAQLDGAFLVRGDGIVTAAGACIQAPAHQHEAFAGLGTRHAAGAAISAATEAVAVVLSQSTGAVSVFKGGRLILSLSQRN